MVHNTQNDRISGLCSSSGFVNTGKHKVQRLRLGLSKEPNRVEGSLPSPEDGNRSSFRNVVSSSIRIPNDGQNPETQ
jgi:hypothetical protein